MRIAVIVGLAMVAGGCRQMLGIDDPTLEQVADAPAGVDGPAAPIDARPDGPTVQTGSCFDRWNQGPKFTSVTRLTELESGNTALDSPFVLTNELVIYYVRGGDVFRAERQSTKDPFDAVTIVAGLSSPSTEGKAFVNDGETRSFFASNRSGGAGSFDLFRGVSNGGNHPSFTVDRGFVSTLDNGNTQVDPHLTQDLLHIYYVNSGVITFATRADINANFGNETALPNLSNVLLQATSPTLTADENLIVFASTRTAKGDLYYATRNSSNDDFGQPILLAGLDSGVLETSPHVSADGCHLYFVSDRDGVQTIYLASLL